MQQLTGIVNVTRIGYYVETKSSGASAVARSSGSTIYQEFIAA
jgi:hypothetical protein